MSLTIQHAAKALKTAEDLVKDLEHSDALKHEPQVVPICDPSVKRKMENIENILRIVEISLKKAPKPSIRPIRTQRRVAIKVVSVMAGLLTFASFLSTAAAAGPVSFVSIGDWGGAGIESASATLHEYNAYWRGWVERDRRNPQITSPKKTEMTVAKSFARVSKTVNAQFILNTGDNFYYYGVKSTEDPLWENAFESVYAQPSLMVKWYSVLGNHDYGFSPEAQVRYKSRNKDRWVLPSRYYSKRIQLGNTSGYATLIMLDTSPCITDYRNNDPTKWDPCGSDFPSPSDCKFHENIIKENCTLQYIWLNTLIPTIPKDDWVIAVGHHPADEIDVMDLTSLLQSADIDLYLNGHTHAMAQYSVDGNPSFVTTGGGCMVNVDENAKQQKQLFKKATAKAKNEQHSFSSIWHKVSAGFTVHTFSDDLLELTTQLVDGHGNPMHTFTVKKKKRARNRPLISNDK